MAVLVPARPDIDIAAEMALRGYQVNPDADPGQCQVNETRGLGACPLARSAKPGGIRVCEPHRLALSRPRRS